MEIKGHSFQGAFEEVTYDESDVGLFESLRLADAMDGFFDERPDRIRIETYFKMDRDAQVRAGKSLIKLSLLSKPVTIQFPDDFQHPDKERATEYLQFVIDNVNKNTGNRAGFRGAMEEMLDTPFIGFGVTEPVYARIQSGKWEGMIGLKKLKELPRETIRFVSDEFGELREVFQDFGNTSSSSTFLRSISDQINVTHNSLTPLDKFIIWSYEKRANNWYGNGLFLPAYKHWWIKEFLIKKWNLYLERKAVPLLIGYTRVGNIRNMNKKLSSVNERTVLTFQKDADEVVAISVKNVSAQFEEAIKYHDAMIFRAFMAPVLLVSQEDIGARALAEVQKEMFMLTVNKISEDFTSRLVQPFEVLIKINFPTIEVMPKVVIPELSETDRVVMSQLVERLVKIGSLDPAAPWIMPTLGLPINAPDAQVGREFISMPGLITPANNTGHEDEEEDRNTGHEDDKNTGHEDEEDEDKK